MRRPQAVLAVWPWRAHMQEHHITRQYTVIQHGGQLRIMAWNDVQHPCFQQRLVAPQAAIAQQGQIVSMLCLRSEEHTSELQSLMRISYAVFCLKKKQQTKTIKINST